MLQNDSIIDGINLQKWESCCLQEVRNRSGGKEQDLALCRLLANSILLSAQLKIKEEVVLQPPPEIVYVVLYLPNCFYHL